MLERIKYKIVPDKDGVISLKSLIDILYKKHYKKVNLLNKDSVINEALDALKLMYEAKQIILVSPDGKEIESKYTDLVLKEVSKELMSYLLMEYGKKTMYAGMVMYNEVYFY